MTENYKETVFLERETKAKVVFARWVYIHPDEWDTSGKSEGWALISDIHRPVQRDAVPVRAVQPLQFDPEVPAPHDDLHTIP